MIVGYMMKRIKRVWSFKVYYSDRSFYLYYDMYPNEGLDFKQFSNKVKKARGN